MCAAVCITLVVMVTQGGKISVWWTGGVYVKPGHWHALHLQPWFQKVWTVFNLNTEQMQSFANKLFADNGFAKCSWAHSNILYTITCFRKWWTLALPWLNSVLFIFTLCPNFFAVHCTRQNNLWNLFFSISFKPRKKPQFLMVYCHINGLI